MERDNKGMKQKLKPGPNNVEQAGEFATKLKTAVDLFKSRIHMHDRYETERLTWNLLRPTFFCCPRWKTTTALLRQVLF